MKLRKYSLEHANGEFEKGWTFWCPACKSEHQFRTRAVAGVRHDGRPWPVWTFDGNMESPTFSPSLLYQTAKGHWEGQKWVETGPKRTICHLHVRAGVIEYCSDNPHAFNGQRVPLQDLPERAT